MDGVSGAGLQVGPEDILVNVISGDIDCQTALLESFSFVFVLKNNLEMFDSFQTRPEVSPSLWKRGCGRICKTLGKF